jgi:protein-histidine pros-kinase
MDVPEFQVSSADEIGSLAVSFNRMRRSLVTAMGMLGD